MSGQRAKGRGLGLSLGRRGRGAAAPAPRADRRLIEAAEEGDAERIAELLEQGVLPDARDRDGRTVLSLAAEGGHTEAVQALLSVGAAVDTRDADGLTPLAFACKQGHTAMAAVLLEGGADVNAAATASAGCCTPGYWCAAYGHLDTAQLLLQRGADPAAPNLLGQRPLHVASEEGHTAFVEQLLRHPAVAATVDVAAHGGHTALAMAAAQGHAAICSLLLAQRAAVDSRDASGSTPLLRCVLSGLCAAEGCHRKAVDVLLQGCADPNALDEDQAGALYYCAAGGDTAIGQLLLEAGASPTQANFRGLQPIHCVSQIGRADFVRLLLRQPGVSPNAASHDGATPLLLATLHGHTEAARALLEAGAEPDAAMADGRTPLMFAALHGAAELQTLLLAHWAAANAVDAVGGRTPLIQVVKGSKLSMVQELLARGAEQVADVRGCTPLIMAVQQPGLSQLVAALLAAVDSAVDAQDDSGCTALYFACGNADATSCSAAASGGSVAADCESQRGSPELVNMLLQGNSGPMRNAQDVRGTVPLYMAVMSGSVATVEVLLAAGARVDIPNSSGQLPLHLASQSGAADIVALLLAAHEAAGVPPVLDTEEVMGFSPLHFAAMQGQLAIVQQLLQAEPGMAALRDNRSRLPIILALLNGHMPAVYCLLDQGEYLIDPTEELLEAMAIGIGDSTLPLYARLAARRALTVPEWHLVPMCCPGLAPALPAVLARSPAEAAEVVARLPEERGDGLRAAMLVLHRAQAAAGVELPPHLLPDLLSQLFAKQHS